MKHRLALAPIVFLAVSLALATSATRAPGGAGQPGEKTAPSAQNASPSFYPVKLDDPSAVYLTPAQFPVRGDGVHDDSAALQQAIDRAGEKPGAGIVFVPSGRYRISRTIYVWAGVRVIGYGPTRPVLELAPHTPGYRHGLGYMIFFSGGGPPHANRPGSGFVHRAAFPGTVPPNSRVEDANAGTFYSAMSNIDIAIGAGNPAAVAIRFHVAQHSFLSHMDFFLGTALAGLKDVGNEGEDLHFHGGQYGIVTGQTSPGWQYTLLDSSFEGQRVAAIREHDVGLTLVHDTFDRVPTAVAIDPGYQDELWIAHSRFEHISGPALVLGDTANPTMEAGALDVICDHVPVFAQLGANGKHTAAPSTIYRVRTFTQGLILSALGDPGSVETVYRAAPLAKLPPPAPPIIRRPPSPATWVNVRSLGVKGDGHTNDTAALQRAIDTHTALYIPSGHYIVTNTLRLRPKTVLIGLDPSTTQIDLPDSTPGFQGPGNPKPLLETPPGGDNIVTGIGLYTNGINPRAVAALWQSGANSLMDDVRFLGGHGTNDLQGHRINPYNSTHTGDPNPRRKWDSQYPSLWVTNGGGGTFADIWTPSTFAQAGMEISNTSTPGHVYELSSEHHMRNEVVLRHVSHWTIVALQTEEEWGEGPFALPLAIADSHDITVANLHSYRVIASYHPFPAAIEVTGSRDLRFRNIFINSNSKVDFDNALLDTDLPRAPVRALQFAALDFSGKTSQTSSAGSQWPSSVLEPHAAVRKVRGGFFSLGGGAADAHGNLYFVDLHWQRIYRWSPASQKLTLVSDAPLQPENLAFDRSGDLVVISRDGNGTVYSFRPGSSAARDGQFTWWKPEPGLPRPGLTPVLPLDYWGSQDFAVRQTAPRPYQYISPDGSTVLAVHSDFVKGTLSWGVKMADVLHAFGLAKAVPGRPFYVTEQKEEKTYAATASATGTFASMRLFAERGGDSVTQDARGNVYLAAGQIFVYDPDGKLRGVIPVPERPLDLVFGGSDERTLFILTHHSVYAVRTRFPGVDFATSSSPRPEGIQKKVGSASGI